MNSHRDRARRGPNRPTFARLGVLGATSWMTWCLSGDLASFGAESRVDPPGFRPRPTGVHALTNARIVPRPGTLLTNATLVVSNGLVAQILEPLPDRDATTMIPAAARIWDSTGLTLYAGFIDPYLTPPGEASPEAPTEPTSESFSLRSDGGTSATASDVVADRKFFGVGGQTTDPGTPGPGAPSREVTPERRVATVYSPDAKWIRALREQGFTAGQIVPGKGILRGQAAVVQFGDLGPNASMLNPDSALCVGFAPARGDGGRDTYPGSLMGVVALLRQTFLDAAHHAEDLAHHERFPEGRERPRFDASLHALQAARQGQTVLFDPGSVLMIDRAARLAPELGIFRRAFLATGREWTRSDLIAATGGPFIVPLTFPALPKFPEPEAWDDVSLDALRAWDWAPENPALLRRLNLDIALTTHGLSDRKEFRSQLRKAIDRGLDPADALAALTVVPARLCGVESRLGVLEPGRLANLTVVEGDYFDPSTTVRGVWVDGVPYYEPPKLPEKPSEATADSKAKSKSTTNAPVAARIAADPRSSRGPMASPPRVLVRDATLWTCGPAGVVTNAQLLVSDGKIQWADHRLAKLPADTLVVDGTGLHVTPGIIDAHSHSMILGNVNEATLPSTAMVRIADVVNSETPNIRLQLAGGVTTVQLLHGSANPIGGQSCVIKLRDGAGPDALKLEGAPEGIKFALGENVKQSNWGEKYTTRFPQTRMGVPTFHANRFEAARQYVAARLPAARIPPPGAPPPRPLRRDLELEAIAEIIDGTRLIHCHSYRQDEILAFLRTMESFGVRVATLQHILEGYKVADEIARHGAGASAFADWWAYKYEVVDAIPHAGSLMHARGVLVGFNSDSADHARRLNLEAAKAVKYGGTPEVEALKFVTSNPARQLGLDRRLGSLEPGKDGDFVIWSGHPLDPRTACLQTWIEGRKYFDRALEPARAKALADERERLIAKARAPQTGPATAETPSAEKARERFFRMALEQSRHLGVADCLDCRNLRQTAP